MSTRKKERVNALDSMKNTAETNCKARLWLEELQDSIRKAIELFPELDGAFSVKMRFDDSEGGGSNVGAVVGVGTV